MIALFSLLIGIYLNPQPGHTEVLPPHFVLVSDIDDTLKITNVRSKREGLHNLFYGSRIFLGMSELYQELTQKKEPTFYVSGSPSSFTDNVRKLLLSSGFCEGEFLLRDYFTFSSWRNWLTTPKFKSETLETIAHKSPYSQLPLTLVGDDTEYDPEVFTTFRDTHPNVIVQAIYIHQITGRALPKGVTSFRTAFEIAVNEVNERLDPRAAERVGKVILDADNLADLFPAYKKCETEYTFELGSEASQSDYLVTLNENLETAIRTYCEQRSKPTWY